MEVENDDMGTLMYEMSVQTGEVVIWPGANASQLTAITIVFSQQLAIQLLPRPTSNNPFFFSKDKSFELHDSLARNPCKKSRCIA